MSFDSTIWRRIDDARQGSREALDTLLATYRPPLLNYLRARGLSDADAEDVVQDVCLEICQDDFLKRADRSKGRFRTLLLRVTRYVLSSNFRKLSREKRGGGRRAIPLDELRDVQVPEGEEQQFNEIWVRNLLAKALDQLRADSEGKKVPYHEVLSMKFLEGISNQDIAERLGCKIHDVDNHLYLGKERLRKHLRQMVRDLCSSPEEHEEETHLLVRFGF
jgi:RNA polymerase sigma-70 factor (ECF subfamily)